MAKQILILGKDTTETLVPIRTDSDGRLTLAADIDLDVEFAQDSGVTNTDTLRIVHVTDVASSTVSIIPDSVSAFAPSADDSTALERGRVSKASAGLFFGVSGFNSSTSAQFIQIHNASVTPDEGVAPLITFTVAASSNFSYDTGTFGKFFSTGISVTNSSVVATKNVDATDADCWFNVLFT